MKHREGNHYAESLYVCLCAYTMILCYKYVSDFKTKTTN